MKIESSKMESLVDYSAGEIYNAITAEYGISAAEVRELLMKKQNEKIIAQHKEEWPWWQNKKARWLTYLPDTTRTEGRRQISAKEEADLEAKVIEFYRKKPADKSTLTLRILYPEWLEAKKDDVKPGTIKRNKSDWLRFYANEEIVDVPLHLLTAKMLKDFLKSKINEYQMGRHQFGNFSSILKQMLEYATDEKGYISENPYLKVKIKWGKDLFNEESKPADKLVFFKDEQPRIIDYCWQKYKDDSQIVQKFVPLAIVFAFNTGLRNGELAAVKFSDIVNGELVVQRMVEYDSRTVLGRVKSGAKKRYVPLTSEALAVIDEVRRRKIEMGLPVNSYIFSVSEPIKTYTRIQATLRNYCKALNMIERSPHDIRRTYISNLIDGGLDIKTVMDIAGHEQASTTYNSYARPVRRAKERAEIIERALSR